MLTIAALTQKFKALNTGNIIHESFIETKEAFEQLNKEQLRAGKTNTGDEIAPRYRSNKYAIAKNEINPLPGLGTPDLRLTGAFYAGIDAEPGKDVIDIISKDEKGPALENKYSGIFGLGTTFKKQYLEDELAPAVQEKINLVTGLKFA